MASICRVFDVAGLPMAELDSTFDRAWVINGEGVMTFVMSLKDPKCRRELLEFGTYIVVEHEHLPAWGGVIDPPREWSGSGEVTITAYTAEHMLTWRVGDDLKIRGTAGSIFQKILSLANKPEDLRIREGDVYTGGPARVETLQSESLLQDLQGLAERSGNDFSIEPVIDDVTKRLSFVASWHKTLGVFRPDVILREGLNLEESGSGLLSEQNAIINEMHGFGDGPDADNRIKSVQSDDTSRSTFKLRQGRKYFSGNEIIGTLEENTRQALLAARNPEKAARLVVLDVGNAWSIRKGDIVPVDMFGAGWQSNGDFGATALVRVVSMRSNDEPNKLDIGVKEVRLNDDTSA